MERLEPIDVTLRMYLHSSKLVRPDSRYERQQTDLVCPGHDTNLIQESVQGATMTLEALVCPQCEKENATSSTQEVQYETSC